MMKIPLWNVFSSRSVLRYDLKNRTHYILRYNKTKVRIMNDGEAFISGSSDKITLSDEN